MTSSIYLYGLYPTKKFDFFLLFNSLLCFHHVQQPQTIIEQKKIIKFLNKTEIQGHLYRTSHLFYFIIIKNTIILLSGYKYYNRNNLDWRDGWYCFEASSCFKYDRFFGKYMDFRWKATSKNYRSCDNKSTSWNSHFSSCSLNLTCYT